MSTVELLRKEIEVTPPELLTEVYHYLIFLKKQAEDERFDGLRLSASSLAKDWQGREEDEAWKNL